MRGVHVPLCDVVPPGYSVKTYKLIRFVIIAGT
jgi:hypothetical protein